MTPPTAAAAIDGPTAASASFWRETPRPSRFSRVLRTAALVAVCAACALLLFIVDVFAFWGGTPNGPADDAERAGMFVRLSLCLGAFSVAVLPFALAALRRLPSRLSPETHAPGTVLGRVAVWAGIGAGFAFAASTAVSSAALPAALVASVSAVTLRHWVIAGIDLGLLVAAGVGYPIWSDASTSDAWVAAVSLVALVLAVVGIGLWRGNRIEQRLLLETRARLTQVEADAMAEHARLTERGAIARDMHDSLSHRLSLISMHAGALEYRQDLDRDQVRNEAATIATAAREASADLRSVLTILREDGGTAPGLNPAELLAAAHAAGQDANLTWEEPLDDSAFGALPAVVAHTVYRAVQESLTNARKHAPGAPVTIALARTATGIRVTARNPVPVPSNVGNRSAAGAGIAASPGYGLVGLAERARLLGGTFTATPPDAGHPDYTLTLELPTEIPAS